MAATIKIKNSSTTGAVPTSSDLVQGELAVNVTDLGLYTENASGTVVKLNAPSIDDKNTGATKRLTIDTSGNLGLGVTPSAWDTLTTLQVKNASFSGYSNNSYVASNAYYGTSNWRYIASAAAARYEQGAGKHEWHVAGSGTAGNAITFTQAMTLDASGNLGVGVTSITGGYKAQINGSLLLGTTANPVITGTTSLTLYGDNSSSTGARIDSSGNLLLGTTSAGGAGLTIVDGKYIWSLGTYNNTTASAANMWIGSSGVFGRSTSALKYKQDIRDVEDFDISGLRPVRYKSKCESDDQTKDHLGLIADEAAEAGFEELVTRNEAGEIEGFQYERLTVVLLKKLQVHEATVQQLQADVAALKG